MTTDERLIQAAAEVDDALEALGVALDAFALADKASPRKHTLNQFSLWGAMMNRAPGVCKLLSLMLRTPAARHQPKTLADQVEAGIRVETANEVPS